MRSTIARPHVVTRRQAIAAARRNRQSCGRKRPENRLETILRQNPDHRIEPQWFGHGFSGTRTTTPSNPRYARRGNCRASRRRSRRPGFGAPLSDRMLAEGRRPQAMGRQPRVSRTARGPPHLPPAGRGGRRSDPSRTLDGRAKSPAKRLALRSGARRPHRCSARHAPGGHVNRGLERRQTRSGVAAAGLAGIGGVKKASGAGAVTQADVQDPGPAGIANRWQLQAVLAPMKSPQTIQPPWTGSLQRNQGMVTTRSRRGRWRQAERGSAAGSNLSGPLAVLTTFEAW